MQNCLFEAFPCYQGDLTTHEIKPDFYNSKYLSLGFSAQVDFLHTGGKEARELKPILKTNTSLSL